MIGSRSSFGDGRRRRRRQVWWRLVRFFVGMAAVFGVGGYGYQVGVSAGQARADKLERDVARFQDDNLELRDRLALLERRSGETDVALEALRRRYLAEVPQGRTAELVGLLEAQLATGVEPERLALLIEAASVAESCAGQPVTKRFMPRTPVSTDPASFVRFDDRIMVTGTGVAARNAEGLAEAWYDPGEPVRIEFRTLDGEVRSVERAVPFTHSLIVDGREYRFAVVAGERQFVEITAQACALPAASEETAAAEPERPPASH